LKKIIIILCIIISIIGIFFFKKREEYVFLHDINEIQSVEIVSKNDWNNVRTLKTLREKEDFLRDFLNMRCYEAKGKPVHVRANTPIIKILYNNGEYELIDYHSNIIYAYGAYNEPSRERRCFNKNEFEKLVEKYWMSLEDKPNSYGGEYLK